VEPPILLFDGVCNLCNGVVRFVLTHDPEARVRFASQQSAFGQDLLRRHGLADSQSVVLLDGERVYERSDAALRVLSLLPAPWRWLEVARFVPKPWRDATYDLIARNRYRVFGKREACLLPRAEWKSRFLDSVV
jgi:predicted DCC family thiol-disulfide oxidoreductase YuxK